MCRTFSLLLVGSVSVLILSIVLQPLMPSSLATTRAANAAYFSSRSSSHTPTAVFVGGTSGIGRAMAESLANYTSGNVNIVIVGRNKNAADAILSAVPKATVPVNHQFIKADVTLSVNGLGAVSEQIKASYPSIDFLVLTTGYLALDGRIENAEGIDRKMATNYYARWKFIHDLAPAFHTDGAKVISVLAAGHGASIDVNDLAIKEGYTISRVAKITPTYTDLMMQSFAALYPKHAFTHTYPGGVRTTIASSSTSCLVRWSAPLVYLLYPFTFSPAECAEYMWYGGATSSQPGVNLAGSKGENLGKAKFGTEEEGRKLWDHTVELVNRPPSNS